MIQNLFTHFNENNPLFKCFLVYNLIDYFNVSIHVLNILPIGKTNPILSLSDQPKWNMFLINAGVYFYWRI